MVLFLHGQQIRIKFCSQVKPDKKLKIVTSWQVSLQWNPQSKKGEAPSSSAVWRILPRQDYVIDARIDYTANDNSCNKNVVLTTDMHAFLSSNDCQL